MPAGRPRSFAEDEVLDVAVQLFLQHGYDGVGISTICKETGLASQSLYNTFGDKAELYRRAMERYGQTANVPLIEALRDTPDPVEAIRGFVHEWRRHAKREDIPGCLFAMALASADSVPACDASVARQFSLRLRSALRARCREAAENGQLPAGANPDALAETLLVLTFGVAVSARGGLPTATVRGAIAQAELLLGG